MITERRFGARKGSVDAEVRDYNVAGRAGRNGPSASVAAAEEKYAADGEAERNAAAAVGHFGDGAVGLRRRYRGNQSASGRRFRRIDRPVASDDNDIRTRRLRSTAAVTVATDTTQWRPSYLLAITTAQATAGPPSGRGSRGFVPCNGPLSAAGSQSAIADSLCYFFLSYLLVSDFRSPFAYVLIRYLIISVIVVLRQHYYVRVEKITFVHHRLRKSTDIRVCKSPQDCAFAVRRAVYFVGPR